MNNKQLWLLFLVLFIIGGLVWFSIFYWIVDSNLSQSLQLGSCLGLLFSVLSTLLLGQIQNSVIFWNYAKEIEQLVEDTDSKEGLANIVNSELMKLSHLSMGAPHHEEIRRLRSIISMKSKYVK